jgi:hypothetical protein
VSKSSILRIGGFIGSAGVTAALVGAAVSGTGAYFSDTEQGSITGTMGSIQLQSGDTQISFTKMLPGAAQSDTVTYRNNGANAQDVWVVFDEEALGDGSGTKGLNSLGTYGEVHVASNGTEIFGSKNLNDRASTCPPGEGDPACNPLPHMLKLVGDLQPGATGAMQFSFTPGAKFKNVQGAPILNLPYQLVATQPGIAPDNPLN